MRKVSNANKGTYTVIQYNMHMHMCVKRCASNNTKMSILEWCSIVAHFHVWPSMSKVNELTNADTCCPRSVSFSTKNVELFWHSSSGCYYGAHFRNDGIAICFAKCIFFSFSTWWTKFMSYFKVLSVLPRNDLWYSLETGIIIKLFTKIDIISLFGFLFLHFFPNTQPHHFTKCEHTVAKCYHSFTCWNFSVALLLCCR